jgi:hypothetical protein
MITPEMISNALGRPQVAGDTGHASISPATSHAAAVERYPDQSGAGRDPFALRNVRPSPDRNGIAIQGAGYNRGAHVNTSAAWDFRITSRDSSNPRWLDSNFAKASRRSPPIFVGLKWPDDNRNRQDNAASHRAARWLRTQDAASIVLAVSVIVAAMSILCSAAIHAVQTVMTW